MHTKILVFSNGIIIWQIGLLLSKVLLLHKKILIQLQRSSKKKSNDLHTIKNANKNS